MIDDKTMRNLQNLSRLKLSPEEEKSLAHQLEDIIQYFEVLSSYDTKGVDPDLGSSVPPELLRDDKHAKGIDQKGIETFAVEYTDGFFVVPKILGDEPDGR